MERITKILEHTGAKMCQYIASVAGGFLVAFETSIPFFIPCLIVTGFDVWAAYCLARRVHKRYPDKSDGKFKSEYKNRILGTMIIVFVALILASYVDTQVLRDSGTDLAVRSVMGIFLFYQIWSILENWSSENDKKIARALQRVMVNKAERHLNVPLSDILLNEKSSINESMEDKENEKD